jgi:hypothetical protein
MPWITAKYDGRCKCCEEDILEGDRIFFEPQDGSYCPSCADEIFGEEDEE